MNYSHEKTVSALIAFDEKESNKKYYNRFALSMYLKALQEAETNMAAGMPMRTAFLKAFVGRLLDKVLKVNDLPVSTREEQRGIF